MDCRSRRCLSLIIFLAVNFAHAESNIQPHALLSSMLLVAPPVTLGRTVVDAQIKPQIKPLSPQTVENYADRTREVLTEVRKIPEAVAAKKILIFEPSFDGMLKEEERLTSEVKRLVAMEGNPEAAKNLNPAEESWKMAFIDNVDTLSQFVSRLGSRLVNDPIASDLPLLTRNYNGSEVSVVNAAKMTPELWKRMEPIFESVADVTSAAAKGNTSKWVFSAEGKNRMTGERYSLGVNLDPLNKEVARQLSFRNRLVRLLPTGKTKERKLALKERNRSLLTLLEFAIGYDMGLHQPAERRDKSFVTNEVRELPEYLP